MHWQDAQNGPRTDDPVGRPADAVAEPTRATGTGPTAGAGPLARSNAVDDVVDDVVARAATAARNEAVAGALREVASVPQRPLAEHPDVYGRAHVGLQQALSEIDEA